MIKEVESRDSAWVVLGLACKNCGNDVKACDIKDDIFEFEWFCSNEECVNNKGTKTYETQEPKWVELKKGW